MFPIPASPETQKNLLYGAAAVGVLLGVMFIMQHLFTMLLIAVLLFATKPTKESFKPFLQAQVEEKGTAPSNSSFISNLITTAITSIGARAFVYERAIFVDYLLCWVVKFQPDPSEAAQIFAIGIANHWFRYTPKPKSQ